MTGVIDAGNNFLSLTHDVAMELERWVPLGTIGGDEPANFQMPNLAAPESIPGKAISGITRFLTGFFMGNRALRMARGAAGITATSRVANAAQPLMAGFMSDFATTSSNDARIADLIISLDNDAANNAIVSYLASDGDESLIENRFKNALEGAGFGFATDLAFKTFRAAKAARRAGRAERAALVSPSDVADAAAQRARLASDPKFTPVTDAELTAGLGNPRGPMVRPSQNTRLDSAARAAMGDSERVVQAVDGAQPADEFFLNLSRINEPEDIQKAMKAMVDIDAGRLNAARGGEHVGFDQMKAMADEMDLSVDDLLTRRRGQPMDAAQAVGYRRLMASSGKQTIDLAQRAKASGRPADLYAFQKALTVHYAIQAEVMDARTATARALASWRIPVSGEMERAEAVGLMFRMNYKDGEAGLLKMADAVLDVAEQSGARGVSALVRNQGTIGQRTGAAITELWINGLLSSPKTHMVNVTGNALTGLWAIPERYLAAKTSQALFDGEIPVQEAMAMAYGTMRGARQGIRLAAKALREGQPTGVTGKIEIPHNAISSEKLGLSGVLGQGADALGHIVRTPGRFLQSEDEFFRAVAYQQQLHAHSLRQAVSEGLEGDALTARVMHLVDNPPEGLRMAAAEFADTQTFTRELGQWGRDFTKLVNKTPGGRFIFPFIRTPINIMKYAFARTPLGPMAGQTRAAIQAGMRAGASDAERAAAAEAYARIGLGTMVMMTAADMARSGTLTGGGPADASLKQAQRRQGIQPYSIKIGDRYYAYNRMDPLGLMMGMAADVAEVSMLAETPEAEKLALAGALAFGKNMANKTWASGVFDMIKAVDDPDRYGTSFITNFAGSFVPAFVRNVESTIDPIPRETRSPTGDGVEDFTARMVNDVRSRIPGLSESLPPRRNLWGEPIDTSSGLGSAFDFLSPIYSSLRKPDAVDAYILENRIKTSMPSRQVQGVPLNAEEYDRYVQLSGETAKRMLDQMFAAGAHRTWTPGPEGSGANAILGAINTAKEQARAQLMGESPRMRDAILTKRLDDQRKLLGAMGADK